MKLNQKIDQLTKRALNVTMLTNRGENDPFYSQMKKLIEEAYKLGMDDGQEFAYGLMEYKAELAYENSLENAINGGAR